MNWGEVDPPDSGDRDLAPFWLGVSARKLLVQKCLNCATHRWPPRGACETCRSFDLVWVAAGESAKIFSWTTVWQTSLEGFRDAVPYAVGIVELDGVPIRMIGYLDIAPDEILPGLGVSVNFREVRSGALLPTWVKSN